MYCSKNFCLFEFKIMSAFIKFRNPAFSNLVAIIFPIVFRVDNSCKSTLYQNLNYRVE